MTDSMKDAPASLADLGERIRSIKFAMVTTRTADGDLRSRPLTTQSHSHTEDEAESVLWFIVSRDTDVAREVTADPVVNVSYSDTKADCYVSISGRAHLSDDPVKKRELWNMFAKAWFSGGVDDPALVLLAVRIDQAEYWDTTDSKMVQVAKMAAAAVRGTPPDIGEHREVGA